MQIKFTLDEGAYPPEKAHDTDAGFDLRAIFPTSGELLEYGQEAFDTGVHVQIPKGYVGYVQGRSGLNVKHGIICPTGVVDSGYTGSIRVKLYSTWAQEDVVDFPEIKAGDKIAQLVIQPIADCKLVQADRLEDTERGNGGFGSTGR
jgi:dUTP pyrophosphatase